MSEPVISGSHPLVPILTPGDRRDTGGHSDGHEQIPADRIRQSFAPTRHVLPAKLRCLSRDVSSRVGGGQVETHFRYHLRKLEKCPELHVDDCKKMRTQVPETL